MSAGAVALTIAISGLVMFGPGLLAGLAVGLRGWVLAATAPLFTYAIAGLAGPWLALLGLPFTATTFSLVTLVVAVAGCIGLVLRRRRTDRTPAPWQTPAQFAVLGCVVLGAVAGGYTVLDGMGRLDAVPQDWDAVFHGGGIRYIAETGDGGLTGMSSLNKYADGTPLYYPNAYHLVAVVVNRFAVPFAGAPLPAVINANTILLPGLLALGLVAMIRVLRGRAVLAGMTAILVVAPQTLLYTSMSRGPLLPFLLGIAVIPAALVALNDFLDRAGADTGFRLALAVVGLFAIHPSTLISAIVFALPMLIQRWLSDLRPGPSDLRPGPGDLRPGPGDLRPGPGDLRPGPRLRAVGRDLAALTATAAVCVAVAWPHLQAAYHRPRADGLQTWPVEHHVVDAVWALLSFRHFHPDPRLGLTVALLLGLVFVRRLGRLRWLAWSALIYGVAWVAVASTNTEWVVALSQPWWNDPWRFTTLAALGLTVIAAHGLAESHAHLRDRWAARRGRARIGANSASMAVATAMLAAFAAVTWLYVPPNAKAISTGYDPDWDHLVTVDEVRAMLELGRIARPGEWAMNDRFDGTNWTYALSGVRTVAAHYDEVRLADDAYLLGRRFRDLDHDPRVRAAADRLNVRWVIIGKKGFVRDTGRQSGLLGHESLPFLTKVYENPDAVIYRIDR